jgi:hypothetical protein
MILGVSILVTLSFGKEGRCGGALFSFYAGRQRRKGVSERDLVKLDFACLWFWGDSLSARLCGRDRTRREFSTSGERRKDFPPPVRSVKASQRRGAAGMKGEVSALPFSLFRA